MSGTNLFRALLGSGIALILILFLLLGYRNTWQLWNIPTLSQTFADTRGITSGAVAYAEGLDPMVTSPGDPWGRKMNYPRVWQGLFWLGVDESHANHLGVIFALLFLAGVVLYVREIDATTAVVMAISVFSPAVLLAIERGNNDLVIFFLLSVALFQIGKRPIATMLLILAAFVLKLYPVFGLASLVRENGKALLRLAIASAVIVLAYVVLTFDDLVLIRAGTPRSTFSFTYGIDVFWMTVQKGLGSDGLGKLLRLLSYGVALVILVAAWLLSRTRATDALRNGQHIDAFRLGTAIYVGTFMLGSNYDYRLVFLLFTIPQLVAWARDPSPFIRNAARATLLAALLSFWFLFWFGFLNPISMDDFKLGNYVAFLLGSVFKWTVFAGSTFLFLCSLPATMTLKWFARPPVTDRS